MDTVRFFAADKLDYAFNNNTLSHQWKLRLADAKRVDYPRIV